MGKHNIEKNTPGYWLLYQFGIGLHNLIHREFYYINRPKKIKEKPSIITPNHQNALMDALAVLFAKHEPLVFLARSDIFKKKAVAAILYFLKILPVYRIRDGYNSLKNNKETFDHTVRVLSSKRGLVVLPEGNHFGAKHLRILKKGFARIAFMTEMNADKPMNLQIVPTAIDYTSYDSFFTRLTVVFGDPFPIQPYLENYKENSQIALNDITKRLSKELKNHIIHIESEEHYDDCLLASAVYAEHKQPHYGTNTQKGRYETQRKITQLLNKTENEKKEVFQQVVSAASKLKDSIQSIPHEIIGQNTGFSSVFAMLLSLILFPLSLPGLVIYGLFWYWPVWFAKKKIADVQFRTSVRFVLYIIQYLLLLLGILIYLVITYPIKTAGIVFFLVIMSGILSIKILRLFYWSYLKLKWYLKSKFNKKLQKQRKDVIEAVASLLTN